jgi:hypothetical protein
LHSLFSPQFVYAWIALSSNKQVLSWIGLCSFPKVHENHQKS